METVKIKDVQKNSRGWYEVTLEDDDRVLATKDDKLSEVATASIGGAVEVEVNTRTKGNFTNHYLQEINGVKESKSFTRSPASAPRSNGGGGRDAATQERIARQWAYGRAIELLMASDESVSFPPTREQFAQITETANLLLVATKE